MGIWRFGILPLGEMNCPLLSGRKTSDLAPPPGDQTGRP